MPKLKIMIPGLIFAALVAGLAMGIQNLKWVQHFHLSSLIIAILIGMFVRNAVQLPTSLDSGIRFSSKKILRLSIILLGFQLSLGEITAIGFKGLLVVTIVSTCTLLFSFLLGKKMGLDRNLSLLIGAGSSVCGASAVAAVAPVIHAEEKDTTFSIATVTIFGTISMFLYPILYKVFHMPNLLYAVWTGTSIHEVAQVVAAGFAAGDNTGQFATLVKLTRVLLIIPIAIILGFTQLKLKAENSRTLRKITIPWFVFGFLAMVILNSARWLPDQLVQEFVSLDRFLLTWAMAGLGLVTSFEKMKQIGLKPFYLGLATTVFISVLGFVAADLFFA